jgi:hypothetical protein
MNVNILETAAQFCANLIEYAHRVIIYELTMKIYNPNKCCVADNINMRVTELAGWLSELFPTTEV